jgi:hypothetical protein
MTRPTYLRVPSSTYAAAKEARARVSASLKRFLGGAPWDEAFGPLISLHDHGGFVVLNGPAPLLEGEPHHQAFLPWTLLLESRRKGKVSDAKLEEAVTSSLKTGWGVLGMLSPPNLTVVIPPPRHRAIASATLSFWSEIVGLGPRYTAGLREGRPFWEVPNNLSYVIAQLGVPASGLNGQQREDQLRALLESVSSPTRSED